MRGTSYDEEPGDRESISYIDFEDTPFEKRDQAWQVEMVSAVFFEVGCTLDPGRFVAAFYTVKDVRNPDTLHEEELWDAVELICLRRGFDVYSSDTRFEVYLPHGPVGTTRTIVADDPKAGQVLVWIGPDKVQVATRPDAGGVWGPPLNLIYDERR